MELKIRNPASLSYPKLIRYTILVVLPMLLVLHTFYFLGFSTYLLRQQRLMPCIPLWIWGAGVKFIVYTIQIGLNFSILVVLTKKLRYALMMVYLAYGILFTGMILVVFKDGCQLPVPGTLIAFFVKLNKSFLLLVLFIAGYLVQRSLSQHPPSNRVRHDQPE